MESLEMIIGITRWTADNFAYNLDKIPDDKLHWQPEPTANSAATITVHATHAISGLHGMLQGEPFSPVDAAQIGAGKSRDELKSDIITAANAFADLLTTYGPADLEGELQFPWGAFPRTRAVSMPTIDLIHHHGQIAYIQTLWGDTDSHFKEMGN